MDELLFLKVIALSDCANIFSAVANWQPRSVDKLTAISLCFIRDVVQRITFSFLDAVYNLADTSTKQGGKRHLFFCSLSLAVLRSASSVGNESSKKMGTGNFGILPIDVADKERKQSWLEDSDK